ncbi:hypothetical protein ANO11243_087050 [Dothideomycetidae sp. 11243]|nr:hypothetical protein ANO11243_087050 [fungal sp. No.11243]
MRPLVPRAREKRALSPLEKLSPDHRTHSKSASDAPYGDPGLIPVIQENGRGSEKIPVDSLHDDSYTPEDTTYHAYRALTAPVHVQPSELPMTPPSASPSMPDSKLAPQKHTTISHSTKRRRRKVMFVMGLIVLLIVLAAILGGVLGTRRHSTSTNEESSAGSNSGGGSSSGSGSDDNGNSSATNPTSINNSTISGNATASGTPIQAMSKTGLFTAAKADGSGVLTYYQTSNGSVFETFYPNAKQVFYAASNLTLMHILATGSPASWSAPAPVSTSHTVFAGTSALCALSLTLNIGWVGVRVYVAMSDDSIVEFGWEPKAHDVMQPWSNRTSFNAAPSTGLACTTSTYNGNTWNHLWYQNATSPQIAHSVLLNNAQRIGWLSTDETNLGADNSFNIMNGSAMAAAVDPTAQVQYLFYQGAADSALKMVISPTNPPAAVQGSRFSLASLGQTSLSSYLTGSDPIVVYQTGGLELQAQRTSLQGNELGNATLLG